VPASPLRPDCPRQLLEVSLRNEQSRLPVAEQTQHPENATQRPVRGKCAPTWSLKCGSSKHGQDKKKMFGSRATNPWPWRHEPVAVTISGTPSTLRTNITRVHVSNTCPQSAGTSRPGGKAKSPRSTAAGRRFHGPGHDLVPSPGISLIRKESAHGRQRKIPAWWSIKGGQAAGPGLGGIPPLPGATTSGHQGRRGHGDYRLLPLAPDSIQ
jgi:hypothetical protein